MNRTTTQLELVAERLRQGQSVLVVVSHERRGRELVSRLLNEQDVPRIDDRESHLQIRFTNGAFLNVADLFQPDAIRGRRFHTAFVGKVKAGQSMWERLREETVRLLEERDTELLILDDEQ